MGIGGANNAPGDMRVGPIPLQPPAPKPKSPLSDTPIIRHNPAPCLITTKTETIPPERFS